MRFNPHVFVFYAVDEGGHFENELLAFAATEDMLEIDRVEFDVSGYEFPHRYR